MVVDEAHRLKNFDCRLIRELRKVDAANRLLITGVSLPSSFDSYRRSISHTTHWIA